MFLLNFDHQNPKSPRNKKSPTYIFGIGAIVFAIAISPTLAANISLNNGGPVEFGQGVTVAASCDSEITVTPFSTFLNSEGAGDFLFTSFSVSNVSSDCEGKILSITSYKSGQSDPLDLYETTGVGIFDQIQVLYLGGNFRFFSGGLLSDDISNFEDGFTVTMVTNGPPPSNPLASALDVDRITIESSDATCSEDCQLGDVGPGGGIIFYVSVTPFTAQYSECQDDCHYLESAQFNWPNPNPALTWSLDTTNTVEGLPHNPGVNDGPGKGSRNTYLMSLQPDRGDITNNAALLSLNYAASDNSAGQWYLPSHAELGEMIDWSFANDDILNLGRGVAYWSSNEVWNEQGQSYGASDLYRQFGMPKWWLGSARPIRAF